MSKRKASSEDGDSAYKKKPILSWGKVDVASFLAANDLQQYAETFGEQGITGESLVALNEADLKSKLGMIKPRERKRLISSIEEFDENATDSSVDSSDDDSDAEAAPQSSSIFQVVSPRAWVIVLATYFAYVSVYCARKPLAVVKSVLETDQGVSTQELANMDTALLSLYAVGQLSLGPLVRVLGRKWALVLAFALSGAATGAFGLVDSPYAMMLLWGLAGLFAAPASPLFSMIVGESVPDSVRGTVLGVWCSCENLGGVFANLVAATALQRGGWRRAFLWSGPAVAMWAPVLLAALPKDKATSTKAKSPGKGSQEQKSSVSPSALSVPGVGPAAACYTLTKCARYCLMFWLPYFLSTYVKFSPAAAGSVAALLDAAGALGAVATGVACDTLYGGATLRCAMHLCACTGIAFALWAAACLSPSSSGSMHVVAIVSVGFFVAGPGGVLGSSARNLVGFSGQARDTALVAAVAGLVNGSGSLGAVLQGLVAPQLVAVLGWPGLFVVLAVAMLGASAVLLPAVAIEAKALKNAAKKIKAA